MAKKRVNLEINEVKKHGSPIEVEDEIEIETKPIVGIVNAVKLNVRKSASAQSEIVKVIDHGEKVMINPATSTDDFYDIGEGFCMKTFITV